MKIEIKCDDETLYLSNEGLTSYNFVEIWGFRRGESMTIPIDELYSAILAFRQSREDSKL